MHLSPSGKLQTDRAAISRNNKGRKDFDTGDTALYQLEIFSTHMEADWESTPGTIAVANTARLNSP